MATYPTTGQDPWGSDLKDYIDDTDADTLAAAETAIADALVSLTALESPGTAGTPLADKGRGAVTSGTSETFLATFKVEENTVAVGDVFELFAILQSSSTGTLTPRVRVGTAGTIAGDTLVNVSGVSAAGTANSFVVVRAYVYVVALGATSTMAAALNGTTTAASFTNTAGAESLGNVPTTADLYITFAGTASAGTYTVRSLVCKKI
jgi:hypothetical protein